MVGNPSQKGLPRGKLPSHVNKSCSEALPIPLGEIRVETYLLFQNSQPADDFRAINQSDYTCLINDDTIDMWRQKLSEKNNPNSVKYVPFLLF